MKKCKYHPELLAAQTDNGPGFVLSAIENAEEHLETALDISNTAWDQHISSGGNGENFDAHQQLYTPVMRHVRGFFWELVGAFDMFLQWANHHFQIGLCVEKVCWRCIKDKKAQVYHEEWTRVLSLLSEAWNSEWFCEVRNYRNFSHRSFMRVNALVPVNGNERKPSVHLLPSREGQVGYPELQELRRYTWGMRHLGKQVFFKYQAGLPEEA